MTYPEYLAIDTRDIQIMSKAMWLKYADNLQSERYNASCIVRAFANALPDPWPTAPGSTARAERWHRVQGWQVRIAVVDEHGDWCIAGHSGSYSVEELIAQGFVPLHDAGAGVALR